MENKESSLYSSLKHRKGYYIEIYLFLFFFYIYRQEVQIKKWKVIEKKKS